MQTNRHPPSASNPEELQREDVLDVLSNRRRRFVVHFLKRREDRVELRELAEHVASWEAGKDPGHLTYRDRKSVQNALRQFHLPKMAEKSFVEYDSRSGEVELTDAAASQDFYVDVIPDRDIPWGAYYVGLSTFNVGCVGAAWIGLWPFTVLPSLAWATFFAIAFVVSSLGHFYDTYYRMRLGARTVPPEVE